MSDLWTGLPNYQPIQPLGYSRCPGHCDNQKHLIPGVSDFVLCTEIGLPPGSHRHSVRSSFHHPPDRHEFRHTDWANFQTHLEELIPFDPQLHNEMAIDTCVENSGAALKALAVPTPKRRPRDDPGPPMPAGMQDENT